MIRKVLNTRLYQKIFAEQAHFKDWRLSQTPEEILSYAVSTTVGRIFYCRWNTITFHPSRKKFS